MPKKDLHAITKMLLRSCVMNTVYGYLAAQQAPCRMFRCTALRRVFGFVLVVVGFVVFDDVVLATKESDHACEERQS